ncbi:MAG TPA: hypothetical protein VJ846_11715, partial [Sphingomicrobium sp.]|nr:hypothetical protein [Sphingomicrobium sp.]
MEDIETTNPVDGEALPAVAPSTSPLRQSSGQADGDEPTLDEQGNPIGEEDPSTDSARTGEEEELEEIERGGKKAKIPSWLKPELMMQADYTRKTQELAEARRAFEAERGAIHHATQTERAAEANLAMIDQQIGHYSTIDWNGWHD